MKMRDFLNIITEDGPSGFEVWFSGSKVVDREGKPLRCYHGTFFDFAEFKHKEAPKRGMAGYGFNRLGFWFDTQTGVPSWLAGYEEGRTQPSPGANIVPCYLSIKNPLVMDSDVFWDEDRDDLIKARDDMRRKRDLGGYEYEVARRYFDHLRAMKKRERSDGFDRLMKMLPNGVQSTTEEVAAFQQEIISEGYDGIHIVDTLADGAANNWHATNWWIAFFPKQIKSIFAKEFNPNSTNISESDLVEV